MVDVNSVVQRGGGPAPDRKRMMRLALGLRSTGEHLQEEER